MTVWVFGDFNRNELLLVRGVRLETTRGLRQSLHEGPAGNMTGKLLGIV